MTNIDVKEAVREKYSLAEFQKASGGVKVDAAVHDLRLTGIEFDSHTLRLIAEANGTAKVAVSDLPKM